MHCILVPVDGSEPALNAVKHTLSMLDNGYSGCIHLMHVMPIIFPAGELEFPDYSLIEKSQKQQAKKILKEAGKLLDKTDLEYKTHIVRGTVSREIVGYAQSHHCDLIVMGTRGMGAFGNLVLGSTATQVVHLSEIPVTLVK